MARKKRVKRVGILTSGGDCPGLNAVIRAVTKHLTPSGIEVLGILEGFVGLVERRFVTLTNDDTSGLLTVGGTILRTSRNKPHKWPLPDGRFADKTKEAVENYKKMGLDCLICLGGGGTQKNAHHLMEEGGINVVTVPKTIDNDVWGTDTCFGFDTGMYIATEAIDRLHTTASSHHRVMLVDIMGNKAGWLALGAGVAGGADVILIPEIKYDLDIVAKSLLYRMEQGKMFSIIAVAEGATSAAEAKSIKLAKKVAKSKGNGQKEPVVRQPKELVSAIVAEYLQSATGLETRITSLGYVQRGGVPTPTDRLLCTKFGTFAAQCVLDQHFGVMVAKLGQNYVPVELEKVAGRRRTVPLNHAWIEAARAVGTCLGDEHPRI